MAVPVAHGRPDAAPRDVPLVHSRGRNSVARGSTPLQSEMLRVANASMGFPPVGRPPEYAVATHDKRRRNEFVNRRSPVQVRSSAPVTSPSLAWDLRPPAASVRGSAPPTTKGRPPTLGNADRRSAVTASTTNLVPPLRSGSRNASRFARLASRNLVALRTRAKTARYYAETSRAGSRGARRTTSTLRPPPGSSGCAGSCRHRRAHPGS